MGTKEKWPNPASSRLIVVTLNRLKWMLKFGRFPRHANQWWVRAPVLDDGVNMPIRICRTLLCPSRSLLPYARTGPAPRLASCDRRRSARVVVTRGVMGSISGRNVHDVEVIWDRCLMSCLGFERIAVSHGMRSAFAEGPLWLYGARKMSAFRRPGVAVKWPAWLRQSLPLAPCQVADVRVRPRYRLDDLHPMSGWAPLCLASPPGADLEEAPEPRRPAVLAPKPGAGGVVIDQARGCRCRSAAGLEQRSVDAVELRPDTAISRLATVDRMRV